MKLIARIFLLALALATAPLATAGSFGGEKIVSSDINIGSQFPEVAYYNGVIHVVWVGYATGKQGDIFYSRSTSSTGSFSTPVNLSANATAASGNDRPQVTAGSNGVFVGWNSHNDTGAVYVKRSTDAGVSFGSAEIIAGVEGDTFYARITDLFTDSQNRVHLGYYTNADTSGLSGMVHHRMSCDGSNWGTDTAVTNQTIDGDVDNEQPRLGEAGGRIYITFRSSRNGNPQGGWPPYSIQMQSGTVSGACTVAWAYPARRIAGGVPFSFSSAYRPDVFGDSTGNVHLTWWENTNGANAAYRKGNPATGTLGAPSTISNFGVDHLEPGGLASTAAAVAGGFQAPAAIVGNGITAFMAYQRNSALSTGVAGFENGPIYLRESGDNGNTWGAEQSISADTKATTPRMAIDNANTQNVAVVWSDVRSGITARVYYRLYTLGSLIGGPSFALSPSPHNFGNQMVGSTSGAQSFTLLNSGTAGNINGIAITGNYAIASNTCGSTLAGGASCAIGVQFTPTALGDRAGAITASTNAIDSPTVATLTGKGVSSTAFAANVNAVVTGFYETILGRSPDSGGATFWSGEATRVQGLGADVKEVFFAMSVQFFNSTEYLNRGTNDTQYLTDLYRTFFIREPDSSGLAFWQSQLTGGMDRGAMLNNFLFSTEFNNHMGSLFTPVSPRPEINLTIDLYRGILGALPDSGGFNFWLGRVRAAQCQGSAAVVTEVGNLATAFINSAEYQQRENARPAAERTKRHVGDLYNAFLRRGGDLEGYNFWVNQISSGAQTRDQARAAFLQSTEFQARVNLVIAAGCSS